MNLGSVFYRNMLREPGATALVDEDDRLTFGEWYEEILAAAGGLKQRGLSAGDHLVAVLTNRRETATIYWACQMLGVIFTPFNWRANGDEVRYVIEDAEAACIVCEGRSRAAVAAADTDVQLLDIDDGGLRELLDSPPVEGPSDIDESQICLMLYTSGTTGRPKGVPRSHRAERLAATHCIALLHYEYGASTLGATPMFHTMGVRSMIMSTLLNGTLVCLRSWDAEGALRLVHEERIDTLFLVPTMFHDMLHHPARKSYDLSSARNIAYAGMPMTSALTEPVCARIRARALRQFLRLQRDLHICRLQPRDAQTGLRRAARNRPAHSCRQSRPGQRPGRRCARGRARGNHCAHGWHGGLCRLLEAARRQQEVNSRWLVLHRRPRLF